MLPRLLSLAARVARIGVVPGSRGPTTIAFLACAALFGSAFLAPRGVAVAMAEEAAGARAAPSPSTSDPSRHDLGEIHMAEGSDSLVILLFGDNRPGYRLQTRSTEFHAIEGLASRNPLSWLRGLVTLPLFVAESIVPTLDGPRDAIAMLTHRPTGGNERGVLRALEALESPDLLVNTGDLVTDGRRGRLWNDFITRSQALRRSARFLAVPGNHEHMASPLGRENWDAALGGPGAPERYWYHADIPEAGVRLVGLDSNVLTDPGDEYPDSLEAALADEQLAWADSVLQGPMPIKLVMLHHPPASSGPHAGDFRSARALPRLERLLDICRRARVTAVLAGHEHLYHRAYLRSADGGGFWQLTTGGAGAPLYKRWDREWRRSMARPLPAGFVVDPEPQVHATAYHFCRIVIPRGAGTDRSIAVEVLRVDGRGRTSRIDAFDLAHPPRR